MDDLFTPLNEDEFRRETASIEKEPKQTTRRTRKIVTEPRNMTTWYAISATHHSHGFCQCDRHEEVQRMLNPEAKSYRDQYPVRMVFEIRPGLLICRDCFIAEADKDD